MGRPPDRFWSHALGGHGPAQVTALDVAVVGLLVDRGAVTQGAGTQGQGFPGLDAPDRPPVTQVVEVELGEVGLEDDASFTGASAVAPGVDEPFPEGGVVLLRLDPARAAGDDYLVQRKAIDPGSGESETGA